MTDPPLWLEQARRRILAAYAAWDIACLHQIAADLSLSGVGTDWKHGYACALGECATELAHQLERSRAPWPPVLQACLFLQRAFP
jgi:hypothetical protein